MIRRIVFVLALVCISTTTASATMGAKRNFVSIVTATHPLAFFRFETPNGSSVVGSATYKAAGGVSATTHSAPIGIADNHALAFNGTDGFVDTTFQGGITTAASMMAWVKLAVAPAGVGHIDYVAGESQSGNDFDLQFENDNRLRFYTAAGSNLSFGPDATTLVNKWHMIVATMDIGTGARAIYWDGKSVATDNGGGNPNKTTEFSAGASKVFSGRYFDGSIDEVAVWNRALSAAEVVAIYGSTHAH
jgi:concanavalin A-like lectin/glucanase superfamily protein